LKKKILPTINLNYELLNIKARHFVFHVNNNNIILHNKEKKKRHGVAIFKEKRRHGVAIFESGLLPKSQAWIISSHEH
jgi:hypothetical protein